MQVSRWGNSLAVRIPADVVRALGLREGDDIHLTPLGPAQLGVLSEEHRREALIDDLRRYRGWMPEDFRFNRDEANGR